MKSKLINKIFLLFTCTVLLSCEVSDPFVDRVASPLLVLITGENGTPTNGLTTEPTVTTKALEDPKVSIKLLELDKTGILDNKIGIDSLPVSGIKITYKLRAGKVISEVTTDKSGSATLNASWEKLGIVSPKAGSSVKLTASGTYKEVSFSKYFIITGI